MTCETSLRAVKSTSRNDAPCVASSLARVASSSFSSSSFSSSESHGSRAGFGGASPATNASEPSPF